MLFGRPDAAARHPARLRVTAWLYASQAWLCRADDDPAKYDHRNITTTIATITPAIVEAYGRNRSTATSSSLREHVGFQFDGDVQISWLTSKFV